MILWKNMRGGGVIGVFLSFSLLERLGIVNYSALLINDLNDLSNHKDIK